MRLTCSQFPESVSYRAMGRSILPLHYILLLVCHKKIVIERTRDLIYLKFVATDFSPKIISPSAGENSGDSA